MLAIQKNEDDRESFVSLHMRQLPADQRSLRWRRWVGWPVVRWGCRGTERMGWPGSQGTGAKPEQKLRAVPPGEPGETTLFLGHLLSSVAGDEAHELLQVQEQSDRWVLRRPGSQQALGPTCPQAPVAAVSSVLLDAEAGSGPARRPGSGCAVGKRRRPAETDHRGSVELDTPKGQREHGEQTAVSGTGLKARPQREGLK